MAQSDKKHSFFTIALAVVFILKFLFLLFSFAAPTYIIGPFTLEAGGKIAYLIVLLLIDAVIVLGYMRRTGWVFPVSLALAIYDPLLATLNKFVFTGAMESELRAAVEKAGQNPVISTDQLYALTKVMMNVSYALTIIIAAAVIAFIFLARKNLEKSRLI
jgi:hypothetical protein